MIRLSAADHGAARQALSDLEHAYNPILHLERVGIWSRGDIGAASGISGSTLRAIAEGKRPSKAQMAALKYALLYRLMNL